VAEGAPAAHFRPAADCRSRLAGSEASNVRIGTNYGLSACVKAGKISGMATVTFDTLDATRKLREAGFDE
jgi:hypothetical protein